MNGALIITWGRNPSGREGKALEVFGKALAYFDELAKSGRVHSHKEYISLTGNSDEVAGTMVVEGSVEELLKIQLEDRTRELLLESALIANNFTVRVAVGGDEQTLMKEIGLYSKTAQALGYL